MSATTITNTKLDCTDEDYEDEVPVPVLRRIVGQLEGYKYCKCYQNDRSASVVKATTPEGNNVVLKFIEDELQVDREAYINNQLKGKHTVQLLSLLQSPSPLFTGVLVFDLYDGTLADFSTLDSDELRSMMFQLLLGVKACHGIQYMHMDLREENVFYRKTTVNTAENNNSKLNAVASVGMEFALGDFDNSIRQEGHKVFSVLPNNRQAPEVLKRNMVKHFSADMWAIGIIFAQYLLDTKPLFSAGTLRSTREEILQTDLDEKLASISDLDAKDLASKLLHKQHKLRITAEEAVQHPYFKPFFVG